MKKISQPTRLNDAERHVCARLREAREKLGFTQKDFAAQIDITRASLASYEEGRVALRYYVALRICRSYFISEKWLATGQGDWRAVMDIRHHHDLLDLHLSPLLPYAEAFVKLAPIYEEVAEWTKRGERSFRIVPSDLESTRYFIRLLEFSVGEWVKELTPRLAHDLIKQLWEIGDRFLGMARTNGYVPVFTDREWKQVCPEYRQLFDELNPRGKKLLAAEEAAARETAVIAAAADRASLRAHGPAAYAAATAGENKESQELTTIAASGNVPAMQTWNELKTDVQRLTHKRGVKAALARYCNVTPQGVAKWLDPEGKTEPGAEATLKLLEWVKEQARQKPSASSATTAPAPKPPAKQPAKKKR